MNKLLQQKFFRLLSEYSQRKVSASEFTEAIEELATHVANFSIGKSSVSCPLKPSDSAPLKHSTMPP